MHDTQSLTESLLDIIKGIEDKTIMLPEFQRDFRWELEQTYDLFDSLIRSIFIGTIIYGKPSFGMTLREIDQRPRRGNGSRASLKTHNYTTEEMSSADRPRTCGLFSTDNNASRRSTVHLLVLMPSILSYAMILI